MKKLSAVIVLALLLFNAYSQDSIKKDTAWKAGGLFAFTIAQTGFTNWAGGGENSYSYNGRLGLFANYVKGKAAWENNLDMAYGMASQGTNGIRKTDDLIELNSKYGYKASEKWFYTAVVNARTQFDKGYLYSDVDSVEPKVISESFAPLYVNLALGMDYKPDKYTSVFLSPLNLKNIYVKNSTYAPGYSIDSSKNLRTDIGAIIKFKYERALVKNLNFLTKFQVFANYQDLNEIQDLDLNWEVLITMNVFKVLSININTNLIWDKDVKFVEEDGSLGNARGQFKEIFGAGLAYKF
jgi:hypothetical protein